MDKLQMEIEFARRNGTQDKLYNKLVVRLIRKRYPLNEELSILRKRDRNPEEFAEYDEYVEQCKRQAKEAVYG